MRHSVFFWKMLEYTDELKNKRLHCGFGKLASQQYYHISATHFSRDTSRHVLIWRTFVLDLTDRTHMVLSCTMQNTKKKNTCRVGTISPSNYIIKIRNDQKSDTTQSKPPRKYQKTLDQYNEMHVNYLGIYQAKSKWHVLDCFVM